MEDEPEVVVDRLTGAIYHDGHGPDVREYSKFSMPRTVRTRRGTLKFTGGVMKWVKKRKGWK